MKKIIILNILFIFCFVSLSLAGGEARLQYNPFSDKYEFIKPGAVLTNLRERAPKVDIEVEDSSEFASIILDLYAFLGQDTWKAINKFLVEKNIN